MERTKGESETTAAEGEIHSEMHMRSGPSRRPEDDPNDNRARTDGFRATASDYASAARDRLENTSARAQQLFFRTSTSTGGISRYPLAALGVAFSTGLVVAAMTGGERRHWLIEKFRRQLRTVFVSAVTAVVVHEIHNFVEGDERLETMLRPFLQIDDDPEEFDSPFDDFNEDDLV